MEEWILAMLRSWKCTNRKTEKWNVEWEVENDKCNGRMNPRNAQILKMYEPENRKMKCEMIIRKWINELWPQRGLTYLVIIIQPDHWPWKGHIFCTPLLKWKMLKGKSSHLFVDILSSIALNFFS
jgi:hypothetical protein